MHLELYALVRTYEKDGRKMSELLYVLSDL